jgi:DNA (cytosine-5)-methyltransferase 3A
MNVLSLFDGMSCGQQALEMANIKVDQYFASEIDKYAIVVTMANYPNTIQLGSIIDLDGTKLPKIDLLIGGSPCQSFSFAGRRNGMTTKSEVEILSLEHYLELKAEGYEFEGQSYLFWEYIRILNEVKPTYFLLENVVMEERWQRVISKAIGVNPIEINSNLLSAQNRIRIYWTNIGMKPMGLFGDLLSIIEQPKDKKIYLKDILQDNPDAKFYLNKVNIEMLKRHDKLKNLENIKSATLVASYHKMGRDQQYVCEPVDERYYLTEKQIDVIGKCNEKGNQPKVFSTNNNHPSSISTEQHDSILGADFRYDKGIKIRKGGKFPTLTTDAEQQYIIPKDSFFYNEAKSNMNEITEMGIYKNSRIRKLTPVECERLQTVKDNYTNKGISDTQRYRMIGNGWTVAVIAHIFSYLNQ